MEMVTTDKNSNFLFSSESVTEGHPDKVADQISDHILDKMIEQDPKSRVACETMVTTGMAIVAGEITSDSYIDIPEVVRETIKDIGYNNSDMGFDWRTCAVLSTIDKQSLDISAGVDEGSGLFKEQGAGDQGIMFGYASNETKSLMPMPIYYAHKLTAGLTAARKSGLIPWLRPDGKSQVTVEYVNGKPRRIHTIVIAAQHEPDIDYNTIKNTIIQLVIQNIIPVDLLDINTKYFINTTGKFVTGGPMGDCGLTGRKIVADTYGGFGSHGGGAFSGKDPSKVDRSASYMCRYIAKNIVAAKIAKKCEIQIAYTIGRAKPVSVLVNTFGTKIIPARQLNEIVRTKFDLRPLAIIERLNLLRPIYRKVCNYGHFGREAEEFTWENTDMINELQKLL